MTQCKSFLPQINNNSKILILGSMPGIKSLEMQEYYAHPKNRFWKLMEIICNQKDLSNLNYKNKIEIILNNNFALFDVIKTCDRKGSLDTNIKKEIPNNIPELLNKYKNIKTICLNGNKAYCTFKKYFPELLQQYKCYKMPSTSPLNTRYSFEKLYNVWKNALK